MRKALSLLLLMLALRSTAQTALYVDSSVSTSGTGFAWTTAYKTLNEALNVANAAATTQKYIINVAKGTYYPTGVQSCTNRDSTFQIRRGGIKILGGFPNGGGIRNVAANPTVLSGDIGTAADIADNSYHVMLVTDIPANADTALVDGFSVINGNATGTGTRSYGTSHQISRDAGGGFYLNTIFPSTGTIILYSGLHNRFVINNCSIKNNKAVKGGAINDSLVYMSIYNSALSNNTATSGGAIYNYQGAPNIYSSTISNNVAVDGGGFYGFRGGTPFLSSNSPRFTNCVLDGNVANNASGKGGAIYDEFINASGMGASGCLFTNNSARMGGAVFLYGDNLITASSTLTSVSSSTFIANKADSVGGGVFASMFNNASVGNICSGDTFTSNKANNAGGGIYVVAVGLSLITTGSVTDCTFINDSAALGGGLYSDIFNGSFFGTVRNCKFLSNKANNGAGLYAKGNIFNCIFSGNLAAGNGGGIYTSAFTGMSNLFSGNKAMGKGGAICDSVGSSSITNCTFSGDTAALGNALYNTGSSHPTLLNCIVWDGVTNNIVNNTGSTAAITYSNVQGGYTGTGNLSSDPQFVSPVAASMAPTTVGNYQVPGCSPTVNSGQNTGSYTTLKDLLGRDRLSATIVDRGAYEFQDSLTGNNSICVGDSSQLSNSHPGGTWTSSDTTIAKVSVTGMVRGIANGAVDITYTYTISPCGGNVAGKIRFFVNSIPNLPPINGGTSMCVGTSTNIDNPQMGGVWSSSNPSIATINSAGIITGISVGIDTIIYTYTNSSGCSSRVFKVMNVNGTSLATPITGSNSVCVNASVTLANTTTGGTWSSSSPAVATVNGTGIVTGVSGGTTIITYTVPPSSGCGSSDTMLVTVKALPSVALITGNNAVCVNGIMILNNSTAGGTWSSSNNAIATVSTTGVVNGIAPGTATISYTVTNSNACTNSSTITVLVNAAPAALPAISGSNSVCVDGTTPFSNAQAGGVWISSNPALATVSNTGLVSGVSPGTDTILYVYTNASGCAGTAKKQVIVNPVYSQNIADTICSGGFYTLGSQVLTTEGTYQNTFQTLAGCDSVIILHLKVDTLDNAVILAGNALTAVETGATYQWIDCANGNMPVAGATAQSFTPAANGEYAVIISRNGCSVTSLCLLVSHVGISQIAGNKNEVQIYPNPGRGRFTVSTGSMIAETILIKDMTGKLLMEFHPDGYTSQLDLTGYAAGTYLIEVYSQRTKDIQRLSIIR